VSKSKRGTAFIDGVLGDSEREEPRRLPINELGKRVWDKRRGRVGSGELESRAFARRLVDALSAVGRSVSDLADVLGYSRRQVATWTTSQNPKVPDPAILIAICRTFEISPTYLLLGKGVPSLGATVERAALESEVRSNVRAALLARGHEASAIDDLFVEDGDLIRRLTDTYHLRLRLAPVVRLLGLTADELKFIVREIEVRLVRIAPVSREAAVAKATRGRRKKLSRKAIRP